MRGGRGKRKDDGKFRPRKPWANAFGFLGHRPAGSPRWPRLSVGKLACPWCIWISFSSAPGVRKCRGLAMISTGTLKRRRPRMSGSWKATYFYLGPSLPRATRVMISLSSQRLGNSSAISPAPLVASERRCRGRQRPAIGKMTRWILLTDRAAARRNATAFAALDHRCETNNFDDLRRLYDSGNSTSNRTARKLCLNNAPAGTLHGLRTRMIRDPSPIRVNIKSTSTVTTSASALLNERPHIETSSVSVDDAIELAKKYIDELPAKTGAGFLRAGRRPSHRSARAAFTRSRKWKLSAATGLATAGISFVFRA